MTTGVRATITIGLPVYNGEPFLTESIDSILGQTYEDIALVISDNGSTDGTEEICRATAARDRRVTYERHDENRGAAWNYNRTIALGSSPYFKWAAADDMLAPTCIERCYETLSNAPSSVVMVYPRTMLVDAKGNEMGEWNDGLDVRSRSPALRFNQVVRNVVLGNGIFGLVRTEALLQTRLHGNYPSADWVYLAELALLGEIWEIPEPLFLRRMHEKTSRAANASLEEISAWFDPAAKPETNEKRRLREEYVQAIRHARLSPRERAAALALFAPVWIRRHSAVMRKQPPPRAVCSRSVRSEEGECFGEFSRQGVTRVPVAVRQSTVSIAGDRLAGGEHETAKASAVPNGPELRLRRGEPLIRDSLRLHRAGVVSRRSLEHPDETREDAVVVGADRARPAATIHRQCLGDIDDPLAVRRDAQPHLVVDRRSERLVEAADAVEDRPRHSNGVVDEVAVEERSMQCIRIRRHGRRLPSLHPSSRRIRPVDASSTYASACAMPIPGSASNAAPMVSR